MKLLTGTLTGTGNQRSQRPAFEDELADEVEDESLDSTAASADEPSAAETSDVDESAEKD